MRVASRGYLRTDAKADDHFPFRRVLSLHKLIEHWRTVAEADGPRGAAARDLVERAERIPDLVEGISDPKSLAAHADTIDELMAAAIPQARAGSWIVGAMTPFRMEPFYGTPGFLDLLSVESWHTDAGSTGVFGDERKMAQAKGMHAYHLIAQCFYGISASARFPSVFRSDGADGMHQYFRVHVDPVFVDINVVGELPELSTEDRKRLADRPLDFELWSSLLPAHHFEFRGFVIITLLDVTDHETHSLLKNDLLQKDALTSPGKIDGIESHLRSLLRIPDLRLGVIGLPSGRFEDIGRARALGRSLLLDELGVPECRSPDKSSYAHLVETGEPVVITDLDECEWCTAFEHRIRFQHYRGLLLAPMRDGDRLVGVVELASAEPGALSAFSVAQLMDVVNLFTAAMNRTIDERRDKVQALIKERFTSIHPSVEWRFRKAAERILDGTVDADAGKGGSGEPESVVFDHVYPLYGLSDIRDSSIRRNHAIRDDLVEQLGLALAVVVEASARSPLPALDELGFRLSRFAERLESDFSSEIDISALDFLRRDVEPLFDRLATTGQSVRAKVEEYRVALDPKLGVLYKRRRDYEQSVAIVNRTVSSFLNRREEESQVMFPHYFEKFEADGVDYNIYVGDSMSEDRRFDELFLRNLRLWQLLTMCGIVWELTEVAPTMPIPLETAHLVLVQDFPIAIRFSNDEKRFGVDGAYNARYMIVKKRIDKSFIRDSNERLTQPGKIAIVYSQEKERREYERYIEYLQAAGYVDGDVEHVEIEPLQGVSGLRALRVRVNERRPEMEARVRPDWAATANDE